MRDDIQFMTSMVGHVADAIGSLEQAVFALAATTLIGALVIALAVRAGAVK